MTIFHAENQTVTGEACLELAEIISIVLAYECRQDTVHDIYLMMDGGG
jgi:hypothetical protein